MTLPQALTSLYNFLLCVRSTWMFAASIVRLTTNNKTGCIWKPKQFF